jgi:hypothetical protein
LTSQFGGQSHGGLAIPRFANDFEAVVAENLDDIHTNQGLVFCHHYSTGSGWG